jgi:hypothetical protein
MGARYPPREAARLELGGPAALLLLARQVLLVLVDRVNVARLAAQPVRNAKEGGERRAARSSYIPRSPDSPVLKPTDCAANAKHPRFIAAEPCVDDDGEFSATAQPRQPRCASRQTCMAPAA